MNDEQLEQLDAALSRIEELEAKLERLRLAEESHRLLLDDILIEAEDNEDKDGSWIGASTVRRIRRELVDA